MKISIRMITMAAISLILNPPTRLLPPTISASGRAIRVKLTPAPPMAMASANRAIMNSLSDEADSRRSAVSVPFLMVSYCSILVSTMLVRASSESTFFSTVPMS